MQPLDRCRVHSLFVSHLEPVGGEQHTHRLCRRAQPRGRRCDLLKVASRCRHRVGRELAQTLPVGDGPKGEGSGRAQVCTHRLGRGVHERWNLQIGRRLEHDDQLCLISECAAPRVDELEACGEPLLRDLGQRERPTGCVRPPLAGQQALKVLRTRGDAQGVSVEGGAVRRHHLHVGEATIAELGDGARLLGEAAHELDRCGGGRVGGSAGALASGRWHEWARAMRAVAPF